MIEQNERLTGLTHYYPTPHTPEASYQHSIASGVSDDGMSYEYGVCRTCHHRFVTRIPFAAGENKHGYAQRLYRLAKDEAHDEALATEAKYIELRGLLSSDPSEALYRAEEELPHFLFLTFVESVTGLTADEEAARDAYDAAYDEEQTALEEGRAVRLHHCYLCYLAETGQPDEVGDLGPLRGVVRTRIGGGSDPTEVYVLTCGHSII